MATKPRMGRPPKAAADKRSETLLIKLTPSERKRFKAKAKRAGKPLTVWIRGLCEEAN